MDLLMETVLALGAGLLLNLMPCVLPIIPLKVQAITRTTDHQFSRRVIAASVFLLGTLLFFLVLGALIGSLNLFWGSLFQSTIFLIIITLFFFIAGFMLWLDLSIPLPQVFSTLQGRGYWEPFLSGVLIAVLSTPCTGPFLGGVLAFALLQPIALTLWLFAWIAIGLALPVMSLILLPQGLAYLPRQREWTQVLKQLLGWMLIAAGAYFLISLLPAFWMTLIHYLLFACFFIWLIVRGLRAKQWVTRALIIVLAVIGLWLLFLYAWPSKAETINWQRFSQQALITAKQQHRPVLVEFTADWCINCKVLEKTVYQDRAVLTAAKQVNLLPLQIDLTQPNGPQEVLLKQWGGAGLPYAVIFNRDGKIIQRLADLFRAKTLATAILHAGGSNE